MQSQQLPTESQVLEDEVLPGTENADQPTEEMSKRHDHGKNCSGKIRIQLCAKSFILQGYDVLAKHTSNARRKCRDEHGQASAAHGACHEPGEYGHKPAGDSGEEAESDERSSEERQLNTGQESGHRWVNNISPLEITRIGVSEQLVAVESVARAGHEMHRGECEAENPARRCRWRESDATEVNRA